MPRSCCATGAAKDMNPGFVDALCSALDALGSAPDARAYFFLSCQEKVAKKKARPLRRPAFAGVSALLSRNGRAAELGPAALRQSSPCFPVASCAARRRRGQIENQLCIDRQRLQVSLGSPSPSCSAEQRSRAGGSRRALFEGRSPELRSRPAWRVAQGSQRSWPRNAGIAFSLASFFWRPKRKNARASGAEPSASGPKPCVSVPTVAGQAPTDPPE